MSKSRFTHYAMISAAIYFMGQCVDLASTYILSPGLVRESNLMVQKLDLGWFYVVSMAIASTILMFMAQLWMWRRLGEHLPDNGTSYRGFYRSLLYGDAADSSANRFGFRVPNALMGVVFVVAYAAIASKLMTCAWNVSLLTGLMESNSHILFRTIKSLVSAGFGLLMFFAVPFWMHKRGSRQ